jgi:hypothetical protein
MKKRMMTMNKLHGSPYDRGSADAYYRRPIRPHYCPSGNNQGIEDCDLTKEQEMEYLKGYWDQQKSGDFKDYE